VTLPFGNGAERVLENKQLGGSVHGLDFNRHTAAHLFRSAQEGIVFALNYGFDIMNKLGCRAGTVRAGDANMFLSPLFGEAFAATTGATVELYNTDGAQGAARAAGIGAGIYKNSRSLYGPAYHPRHRAQSQSLRDAYQEAYVRWLRCLLSELNV
jgi:xylulokinase